MSDRAQIKEREPSTITVVDSLTKGSMFLWVAGGCLRGGTPSSHPPVRLHVLGENPFPGSSLLLRSPGFLKDRLRLAYELAL